MQPADWFTHLRAGPAPEHTGPAGREGPATLVDDEDDWPAGAFAAATSTGRAVRGATTMATCTTPPMTGPVKQGQ